MKGILVCLFILITNLISAQTNNQQSTHDLNSPELFGDITDCRNLVNSGKSQSEKDELQKDYWILLGIVSDLQKYQQLFLTEGELINLFPSAYFHTTFSEMKNIVSLVYTYPIEKMKQMIAFYDAYKWNRETWENGMYNNVEPHWRKHFEYAKSVSNDAGLFCSNFGFVLATGIAAHVQCDLPRAINYSYKNRFDKHLLSNNYKYLLDFSSTNNIFKFTKNKTLDDVQVFHPYCSSYDLQLVLNWRKGALTDVLNGFVEEYSKFSEKNGFKKVLTDDDVIYLRQVAWNSAFSGKPILNLNGYPMLGQPIMNHSSLLSIGKKLCPPEPEPDIAAATPTSQQTNIPTTGQPVGGTTPEELGKILLKALKTNDKKLWIACFTPKEVWLPKAFEVKFDRESFYSTLLKEHISGFDLLREKLEEKGLSNLTSIKFSRVFFQRFERREDSYMKEGEFLGQNFYIEFTYGTEFVGKIGHMSISTYKKGNYFVSYQSGQLEVARQ